MDRRNKNKFASLIDVVKSVKLDDKEAQRLLYVFLKEESFPSVKRYLSARRGNENDAEDLFHEAIIILMEAIQSGKFKLLQLSWRSYTNQLCAYLMRVVQNLWKKELRWRGRERVTSEEAIIHSWSLDLSTALVKEKFENLGQEYQVLLMLYFKKKLSPRLIARQLKITTAEVNKKLSKCIDDLLKEVGQVLDQNKKEWLFDLLAKGMERMEERCQNILKQFYFEKKSMGELAKLLGYENAHSVTEQKSRCMKRLNTILVAMLLDTKVLN